MWGRTGCLVASYRGMLGRACCLVATSRAVPAGGSLTIPTYMIDFLLLSLALTASPSNNRPLLICSATLRTRHLGIRIGILLHICRNDSFQLTNLVCWCLSAVHDGQRKGSSELERVHSIALVLQRTRSGTRYYSCPRRGALLVPLCH